jgi:type II secretory pathway pseudopilin PulG
MRNRKRRRIAFTLAEVLITLGIIGVVAMLTVPVLIGKIEDYRFQQAWKKEYSAIAQVFEKIRNDHDDFSFIVNGTWPTLYNTMQQYMNIAKLCGYYAAHDTGCYVKSTGTLTFNYVSMAKNSLYEDNFDDGQFILLDGALVMLEDYTGNKIIWVDVNGYYKPPNTLGKDLFGIRILTDRIEPLGAIGTGTSIGTCNTTEVSASDVGQYTMKISGAGCSSKYLEQ